MFMILKVAYTSGPFFFEKKKIWRGSPVHINYYQIDQMHQ